MKPVWSCELVWQQRPLVHRGRNKGDQKDLPSGAQEDTLQHRWFFSQETVFEGKTILVKNLQSKLILKNTQVKICKFGMMKMETVAQFCEDAKNH